MKIPQPIKNFIEKKVELNAMIFPQKYPDIDAFNDFQAGYRYNALSSENLVGKEGEFEENWFVICSNYCDDPFIVDFSEKEKGYPIYFAYHGAGSWTPIKIAENIDDFLLQISEIKKLENDKEQIISYLETNFDLENEFWKEAYQGFAEQEYETEQLINDSDEDWILGKVFITDIGENRTLVVSQLKMVFGLTPQEALLLSKQPEIEFSKGYLVHLKNDINLLQSLGATAVFRADKI